MKRWKPKVKQKKKDIKKKEKMENKKEELVDLQDQLFVQWGVSILYLRRPPARETSK